MNNLQVLANIKFVSALQDGSDTVCLGVDTLNTETLEVTTVFTMHTVLLMLRNLLRRQDCICPEY